jgi:hypothetical protein
LNFHSSFSAGAFRGKIQRLDTYRIEFKKERLRLKGRERKIYIITTTTTNGGDKGKRNILGERMKKKKVSLESLWLAIPRYRFLIFKFVVEYLKRVQNSIALTDQDYLITNAFV